MCTKEKWEIEDRQTRLFLSGQTQKSLMRAGAEAAFLKRPSKGRRFSCSETVCKKSFVQRLRFFFYATVFEIYLTSCYSYYCSNYHLHSCCTHFISHFFFQDTPGAAGPRTKGESYIFPCARTPPEKPAAFYIHHGLGGGGGVHSQGRAAQGEGGGERTAGGKCTHTHAQSNKRK